MIRTLIKRKENFLTYKEIQMGAVAKSYKRKGFLINEEMRKYLLISVEAVSHILIYDFALTCLLQGYTIVQYT